MLRLPDPKNDTLNRKALLKVFGLAGGGLIAANCGGGGGGGSTVTPAASATAGANSLATSAATASATATATAAATATASGSASTLSTCAVTNEGEIGPYFTDDSLATYNRSNILSNLDGTNTQVGIPLSLTLFVRDSRNGCALMVGNQIDIWHCNSYGIYSNESVENTTGQQWLRGYQLTDSNGSATFKTIIPGWYAGRTTHIHLRIRSTYSNASSTSDGTNTTQIFFPQTLVDTLDTTVAPYSSEGRNSTTNAGDRVYAQQTLGLNLLSLTGSTSAGYAASFTIDLPIT